MTFDFHSYDPPKYGMYNFSSAAGQVGDNNKSPSLTIFGRTKQKRHRMHQLDIHSAATLKAARADSVLRQQIDTHVPPFTHRKQRIVRREPQDGQYPDAQVEKRARSTAGAAAALKALVRLPSRLIRISE